MFQLARLLAETTLRIGPDREATASRARMALQTKGRKSVP